MKIQLKNNQTPNDDLTLIRGEQEINVFDKISTLSTKTFNAATITIEDTEGTPSATATINNNTLEMQFTSIKGEDGDKGKQGPDGIIGNTATYSSNVSTLFNVANTTGNSTTKTMTQKAITDLFQNITLGIMDTILDIKRIVKIYGDNLKLLSAYFVIKNQNLILNDITKPGNCIENIQIIMGNDDITSTAYSNNVINITNVTDNVTITIETTSVTDTTMFFKRTTGNGITILNDKALLKGVRGNSGIWTQFRPNTLDTSSMAIGYFYKSSNYTLTLDDDGVFTMSNFNIITTLTYYHFGFWFTRVTDHKYYISCQIYIDTDTAQTYGRFGMGFTGTNNSMSGSGYSSPRTKNAWVNVRAITELLASGSYCMLATYNASSGVQRWLTENTSIKIKNIRCVDLTKLFGAGNEPTTSAEFEKLFPIGQYNYTTGIVLNNSMTNYISKRVDAVGVTPLCNATNTTWVNAPASGAGQTQTPVNGVFTLTVETTNVAKIRPKYDLTRDTTHKFYWRCYVKAPHGYFVFGNYGGTLKTVTLENNGTYERVSYLNTGAASRTDFTIASGTSGETIYIKNPLVVDLTEMFGAGNEPTLAQCDSLLEGIQTWQTAAEFDNWNILQTLPLNVTQLTGKLNGEGESVIIFPNGMKSTVCLPSVTPSFVYKSDSKASYIDLDYIPTGQDIVIKTKFRITSWLNTASIMFFGTNYASGMNRYCLYRNYSSEDGFYCVCGATGAAGVSNNHGTDITLELSYGNMNVNGTDKALPTTTGSENIYPILLMYGANAYLYYFQVYKGEDLVVDCIPYRNGEVVGLYDRARDRIFTLTQASGEGVIYSREPAYEELPEPTYDEIKQEDGIWKAYKRISDVMVNNTVNTSRSEYAPLTQEEIYILDDQTIPTELTVANQGTEEILPTNGATPTTAPAIMEIQYPSIPTRGGFLLGNMNNNENDNIDDTEEIDEEEEIIEEINEI